ncbi:aldo/keto reductase [Agathobaculum sp. NTUH-O15-33]|uniref:aldo/keto reductase n=1 Tax=Agathobaculum sp. NTUH-O15-33 TaxID=3079302 RepID=UPI0029584CE4|nr:aldo/keto reductase [Agathobaculum sp. NTUH-O15-33]WNX84873.1 aldo/keto reductase [Agathobaculum sp. NTUH-O15-33]
MKYANIEGVQLPVSRMISGTAQYENWMREEPLFEVLDAAVELGVNAIDSGREYADGACEKAIGSWLRARGNRDQVVLISKGGHHNAIRKRVTPYDVTADIMDSLALLGTDYIDIYMLHRDDETMPVGPIVEMLHRHWEAGRICTYGASNWSLQRIQQANEYAKAHGLRPFLVASQHFSLGEQMDDPHGGGCISMTGDAMQAAREWFATQHMPLLAYSSLCMGLFSGRFNRENYKRLFEEGALPEPCVRAYCCEQNFARLDRAAALAVQKGVSTAAVALAYVIHCSDYYGFDIFALVGSANAAEVKANVDAVNLELTQAEVHWLNNG